LIAVDTNLLVYSHRRECPLHTGAWSCMRELVASRRAWAIPVHCLVEFAAVVSNSRIWRQVSTPEHIAAQVTAWRSSPDLRLLSDDDAVWERCAGLARSGRILAGQWYDARIAAVCLSHGVSELWTVDRDYSRFPDLETVNPLTSR
jgi:predicted nucleic acid-binding protein